MRPPAKSWQTSVVLYTARFAQITNPYIWDSGRPYLLTNSYRLSQNQFPLTQE
jgi:hypothetical protein